MDTSPAPVVLECESLYGGLLITFDDGKIGLYSAELLHRLLPEAKEILPTDLESAPEREAPFEPPARKDFLP